MCCHPCFKLFFQWPMSRVTSFIALKWKFTSEINVTLVFMIKSTSVAGVWGCGG